MATDDERPVENVDPGRAEPSYREIAELAHQYWLERKDGPGNPEDDWFRALEELRARKARSLASPEVSGDQVAQNDRASRGNSPSTSLHVAEVRRTATAVP